MFADMPVTTPTETETVYHSLSDDSDNDSDAGSVMEPPVHPVPAMQGAFEESIIDAADEDDSAPEELTAPQRRAALLDAPSYDDSWLVRWRQKEDTRFHPLLKLVAQIVFGMHLLQQGQAKSAEEVVRILQTHVNDVDAFLERTCEDFDLAIKDVEERVRCLRLPMEHRTTFAAMLEHRQFRNELLAGNEKIERIVARTARMQNATLLDIKVCLESTRQLGRYLDAVGSTDDAADVFAAMRGNEQGWLRFLQDLQVKGINLGHQLHVLTALTEEIAQLAGAASRRQRPRTSSSGESRPLSSSPSSLRSKYTSVGTKPPPAFQLDKPLPAEPWNPSNATVQKTHPVPFESRYEQPRPQPLPPTRVPRADSHSPTMKVAAPAHDSPQSANRPVLEPRDARSMSHNQTRELAQFLKESGPSGPRSERGRSSRPRTSSSSDKEKDNEGHARSRSAGAKEALAAFAQKTRSRSQGAPGLLDAKKNKSTSSFALFAKAEDKEKSVPRETTPTPSYPTAIMTTATNTTHAVATAEPVTLPRKVDSVRSSTISTPSQAEQPSSLPSRNKLCRPSERFSTATTAIPAYTPAHKASASSLSLGLSPRKSSSSLAGPRTVTTLGYGYTGATCGPPVLSSASKLLPRGLGRSTTNLLSGVPSEPEPHARSASVSASVLMTASSVPAKSGAAGAKSLNASARSSTVYGFSSARNKSVHTLPIMKDGVEANPRSVSSGASGLRRLFHRKVESVGVAR